VKHYYWEGTDTHGVLHEGALDSETLSVARENLLRRGFFRLCCWKIQHSRLHRVLSNHEITEILLQLHRLLKSGVELDDALGFAVHEKRSFIEFPALPDA
jgi:type II secretory pathway component PulF